MLKTCSKVKFAKRENQKDDGDIIIGEEANQLLKEYETGELVSIMFS